MFRKNEVGQADFLAIWTKLLSPDKLSRLKKSKGYAFYNLIFCNIPEEIFEVLYSDKKTAPSAPVNCMVAALFLQQQYNWSYDMLMSQIEFNVEIRIALGLKDLESIPFVRRTLFFFKNRIRVYNESTGENLLEQVFLHLTELQLKELKIKTGIQRGDSVLLNTNIGNYSRLSLLVEVLRRVYKILSKEDQQLYSGWFSLYLKGGQKYSYTVKIGEQQEHLESLAKVYYGIHHILCASYAEHPVFQMFERVYAEHFKESESMEEQVPIIIRPKDELGSHTMQSPDDIDATFRTKRDESYQGFVAFGAETCDPDNDLNLVTNLAVETNNTDDSVILENALDKMKELTPDVNEFHQDGGFGSEQVDKKAAQAKITLIQTAIKGRNSEVPISIEGDEKIGFTVNCPNPKHRVVKASKARKRYQAEFDLTKCEVCPFKDKCPTKRERKYEKGVAVFRFKPEDALRQKRHKSIQNIPKERRTLRAGVENLMARLRRGEKNTGKLKIRGQFNFELYIFTMGVIINFERIFRYLKSSGNAFFDFLAFGALYMTLFQRTFNLFILKFNILK
jgi:hypothetical protein